MTNLFSVAKGVLSGNIVGKIASLIGSNSSVTQTALGSMLPSMMKGLISKGSTKEGAGQLLDMIKSNNLGEGTLNNLSSSLEGGNSSSFMDMGSKLNESLFGNKVGDMAKAPGLNAGASSKLMNLASPILLGSLGKVVKANNLDASGLQSYLSNQNIGNVVGAATSAATRSTAAVTETAKSGGGFLKWLIPLLLLVGGGWFLMQQMGGGKDGGDKAEGVAMEKKHDKKHNHEHKKGETHTHADGTVHKGAQHKDGDGMAKKGMDKAGDMAKDGMDKAGDMAKDKMAMVAGLTLDADGNLLKDGKMYLSKGEFSVKDGEYFDADGKSLGFLSKVGKAIGDAGKAVGGAVAGAAGQPADAFKDLFGGMFKKKAEGTAVGSYALHDIVFDPESNRITSFSKNEVEGLAAALKSMPDSKITVQVSSADGAKKAVTKARAQVVHDMLVTLGVADKQISAKGMGDGDGKVAIVID